MNIEIAKDVCRRFGDIYEATGMTLAVPCAAFAFLGVYAAAVGYSGWVIGLGLGWIPAWLAGWLVFAIAVYTWPLMVALAIWAYSLIAS